MRRIAWQGGDVDTVGEFQAFRTLSTALRYAKAYAEGTRDEPDDKAALHTAETHATS